MKHYIPQYSSGGRPLPVTAVRFYQPLEIRFDDRRSGLFYYVCVVSPHDHVEAVGACAQGCVGHSTPEEAREHYRQYLIDNCSRYDGRLSTPCACAVCGKPTRFFAKIEAECSWESIGLCRRHLNPKGLAEAFVFEDFHLIQVSDPKTNTVVVLQDQVGLGSVVHPPIPVEAPELTPPDF